MNEIDLSEKLRQLEAEVDKEVSIQNETRQRIWDEMTGNKPYVPTVRHTIPTLYQRTPAFRQLLLLRLFPPAKKLRSMTSMLL